MKKTKMAPADARTFDELCSLQRDNKDIGKNWWILIQENATSHEVCIHEQSHGEASRQQVIIPREIFLRMIRWYTTPVTTRRRRK